MMRKSVWLALLVVVALPSMAQTAAAAPTCENGVVVQGRCIHTCDGEFGPGFQINDGPCNSVNSCDVDTCVEQCTNSEGTPGVHQGVFGRTSCIPVDPDLDPDGLVDDLLHIAHCLATAQKLSC